MIVLGNQVELWENLFAADGTMLLVLEGANIRGMAATLILIGVELLC